MDPVEQPQDADRPELNTLGKAAFEFLRFGANVSNNLSQTFNDITLQGWIRIVVIIGGYLLLRPYLMKLSAKIGTKEMEKQDAKEKAKAEISPNELRGQGRDDDEEEEDADATGADWGQKARVRQREVLKRLIEAEEKRREEEEDLKDIEDLLED